MRRAVPESVTKRRSLERIDREAGLEPSVANRSAYATESSHTAEWRNWQTRRIQNPVSFGRVGSSPTSATTADQRRRSWSRAFLGSASRDVLLHQLLQLARLLVRVLAVSALVDVF